MGRSEQVQLRGLVTWGLCVCVAAVVGLAYATEGGNEAEVQQGTSAQAAESSLRVPAGFTAAAGATAETYTGTGWVAEVIHEKTGIRMVFMPAGTFKMGSPATEKDRDRDEGPLHEVRITKPFYIGTYEVTQEQWLTVMEENPSTFEGWGAPVSWST